MQKLIPSCTTWTMRNFCPSENQKYAPFKESNDSQDCTCQQKANNNYCQFYNCNVFGHKELLILLQTGKNTSEGVLFLVKILATTL